MPCGQKIAPPKLGMLQWWHKVHGMEKWQNIVDFNMAFVMVHSKGAGKKNFFEINRLFKVHFMLLGGKHQPKYICSSCNKLWRKKSS